MAIIKDNITHTNNYLFDSNLTMSAKELLTMLININDDYNITMEELCNLTKMILIQLKAH